MENGEAEVEKYKLSQVGLSASGRIDGRRDDE